MNGLARYAAARVLEAEGVDRPSAGDTARGARRAAQAQGTVAAAASSCTSAGGSGGVSSVRMSPGPGEAFFGAVVARAPASATRAFLYVDGTRTAEAPIRSGKARFTVSDTPGRHDLRVVFVARTVAGAASAKGVWLLPASARQARAATRIDGARSAGLARALSGGPPYRAAWAQSIRDGWAAGSNAGALFPAASTVKLGLLAGVLGRIPGDAARSPYGYDLKAMVTWSSNLATNRLLDRLGGTTTAGAGLRALGARRSTFTGEYIVGTELQPSLPAASAGTSPPAVSQRVTTAEDLGRMLFALHAAATGTPGANRETGLTVTDARQAIGWLLGSEQRGDNMSLFAGAAPGLPVAQKNGWLSDARHGAGILYGPNGPLIVVLMTYSDSGVGLAQAQLLGGAVVRSVS